MSEEPKKVSEQEWTEAKDRLEAKYKLAQDTLRAHVKDWPPIEVDGVKMSDPNYWVSHIWNNKMGEARIGITGAVRTKEISFFDMPKFVAHHLLLDKRPMDISPEKTPRIDFPGEASLELFLDNFIPYVATLRHISGSEYEPAKVPRPLRPMTPSTPEKPQNG